MDVVLFQCSAVIIIFLALYIVHQTTVDDVNAIDPVVLCWYRNAGFLFMSCALVNAIYEEASRRSLLTLYYSGAYSMVINAIALWLRARR